jgi:ABC-type polysaccharide/polyol phosphate export permease
MIESAQGSQGSKASVPSWWRTFRISAHLAAIDWRRGWLDHATNTLGPLIAAVALTLFFGAILKGYLQGYVDYGRHVATGVIVWAFISSTTVEASAAFARWSLTLRRSDLPLAAVAAAIALRHTLYFIINMIVLLVVFSLYLWLPLDGLDLLAFLAAIVLLSVFCHAMAAVALLSGGRFRNVIQLVVGIFNVAFLLTPIVWTEHFLGRFEFLVWFNPFRHLVEVVRGPAIGFAADPATWMAAVAVVAGTVLAATWLWRRYAPWVRYWI